MKDEYEDMAESEQFGVVVRINTHPQSRMVYVIIKASLFSADMDMLDNKQERKSPQQQMSHISNETVAMYLTQKVHTLDTIQNVLLYIQIMNQVHNRILFTHQQHRQALCQQMC